MKIHPIAIPTPFYVGNVNVYLIAEDPLTLVDTGPKTAAAEAALRDGLRKYKLGLADIKRIVLTHVHEDHCGLTKVVRDEAKDAEIFVHEWEVGHIFGELPPDHHRQIMFRAGVPDDVFAQIQKLYQQIAGLTDVLDHSVFSRLHDEMELEFAGGAFTVLHTPGHTPGSCSLFREANRTLICGDTVLKNITPNPVLAADPLDARRRYNSLGEYLVTLARLRKLAPTLCYGGHGEPVTDFEEVFNRNIRAVNDRQTRIINLISQHKMSAWETAQNLFPEVINENVHRFLAISEAVAHLDYAASENKIRVDLENGIEIYRKL